MRVLLRMVAPLIGVGLSAVGVLLVIEVVAAWVSTAAATGLVVPWPRWRAELEHTSWDHGLVTASALGVALLGLLLLLVGLLARRSDIHLTAPGSEIAVTTSPRVLARFVGRRVRATEDVASAVVTASARRISVSAQSWGDDEKVVRAAVGHGVDALLDELPLRRRPRVSVSVQQRKGPQ